MLGYLDPAAAVWFGLRLAIALTPTSVMSELQAEAFNWLDIA